MVQPERISAISGDTNTGLFVGELSGEVQGTALVSLCADVMFGFQPFAVIENVVVNEAVRGKGLGEALLRHIEVFCEPPRESWRLFGLSHAAIAVA
jgi:GNAT superfamily N-acetyltransferase